VARKPQTYDFVLASTLTKHHALQKWIYGRHSYHHDDARQKISASKSKNQLICHQIKFQVRVLYCNPAAHKFTFTVLFVTFTFTMMFKALLLTALVASTSAFAPAGPGELCASLAIFKGFQSLES
jgi:hypothetical protein